MATPQQDTKPRLTLEQARIEVGYQATWKFAFDVRDNQQVLKKKEGKDWKTAVMGFGTNVQRCGLLQALAFLRRDAGAVYQTLEPELSKHLRARGFLVTTGDLIEVARKLPTMDYIVVTREVMRVALWVKRAAQILCEEGADA